MNKVKVCDPSGEVINLLALDLAHWQYFLGDLCPPLRMARPLSITDIKAMCCPVLLVLSRYYALPAI